jgi:P27 family predicted phage terminase small subunit
LAYSAAMPRRRKPTLTLVSPDHPAPTVAPSRPILAPSHLSDDEASYFREFLASIPPSIRVTASDVPAIARWATFQAMLIAAKQDVEENGATLQTERGQTRNKAFITIREASDAQRRIEAAFGMTPEARVRLGIALQVTADDGWQQNDVRWLCAGDPEFKRFFGGG